MLLVVRFGCLTSQYCITAAFGLGIEIENRSINIRFGVGANYRLHSAGVPSMLVLFYLLGEYRSSHSIPNVHFSG
jgi:hypothetical protein